MKAKLALLGLVLMSARGCDCTAKTQRLDEPDGAVKQKADVGALECKLAEDCPGVGRPCNDSSCGCGTFKFCREGRCLQASAECPRDGGLGFPDAGSMGCMQASDCTGAADTVGVCASAAYSCIDNACIWECEGGRTCTVPTLGDCIACEDSRACPGRMCSFVEENAHVEALSASCNAFIPFRIAQLPVRAKLFSTARPCSTAIEVEGHFGLLGTFIEYDDFRFVGHFPELGGTCTGVQAPTGAIRIIFSCPLCQFVVGP